MFLTHFMPRISFYIPRKHQDFWFCYIFKGYGERGQWHKMEWLWPCFHSIFFSKVFGNMLISQCWFQIYFHNSFILAESKNIYTARTIGFLFCSTLQCKLCGVSKGFMKALGREGLIGFWLEGFNTFLSKIFEAHACPRVILGKIYVFTFCFSIMCKEYCQARFFP